MNKISHKSFTDLLYEHWKDAIHIADALEKERPSVIERFWNEVKRGLVKRSSTIEAGVDDGEGAWAVIKGWPEGLYLSLYSAHSSWGRGTFVCSVCGDCQYPKARRVIRALNNEPPISELKFYSPYKYDGDLYTDVYVVYKLSRDPMEWPALGKGGAMLLAREVAKRADHFVKNVTPAIRKAAKKR